jgi:hypothetical protein
MSAPPIPASGRAMGWRVLLVIALLLVLPSARVTAAAETNWISGTFYLDLNADGRRDPDEPALADAWHTKYGSLKVSDAENGATLVSIRSDGTYRAQVRTPGPIRFDLVGPAADVRRVLVGPPDAVEVGAGVDRIDVGVRVASPPHDERFFEQTGYRVDSDRIWAYFQARGGASVFGQPISGAFPAYWGQDCCTVQIFERGAIQAGAGSVVLLNLLDPPFLPATSARAGLYPPPDEAVRAEAQIRATVPDAWNGTPVMLQRTFFEDAARSASPEEAADPDLLALVGIEVWGFPTSRPAPDPADPSVVYQRFQRGVMKYDARCGCVERVAIGPLFKAMLTGQGLPADVAGQLTDPTFSGRLAPSRLRGSDVLTLSETWALLAMEPR